MSPVDVETAFPESPMSPRFRRRLAVLVGITALLIPILSWIEAENDRQEEQSFVRANRDSLDIFVRIATTSPREQFGADSLREALAVGTEGVSRAAHSELGLPFDYALTLQRASARAERRIQEVGEQMSEAPGEGSELDAATAEALDSGTAELVDLGRGRERGDRRRGPLRHPAGARPLRARAGGDRRLAARPRGPHGRVAGGAHGADHRDGGAGRCGRGRRLRLRLLSSGTLSLRAGRR